MKLPAHLKLLYDCTEIETRVGELGKETFEPDYVGFRFPGTEWLVGYGMDDNGRWRHLPSIYVLAAAQTETD